MFFFQDEHVNEVEEEGKQISYRKIVDKCPLTFDGAYGLTKANHSIEFCENKEIKRMYLFSHFIWKHRIKIVYARRLMQALADEQDPRITKLFDENENVINEICKVQCPFFNKKMNSSRNTQGRVAKVRCQHQSIALTSLKYHLIHHHRVARSLATKLVHSFEEHRRKADICLTPLIPSTLSE